MVSAVKMAQRIPRIHVFLMENGIAGGIRSVVRPQYRVSSGHFSPLDDNGKSKTLRTPFERNIIIRELITGDRR